MRSVCPIAFGLLPAFLVGCGVQQPPSVSKSTASAVQVVAHPSATLAVAVAADPPPAQPKNAYEARTKALFEAADKGQVSRVLELLGAGADINDKDDNGETVLMRAVARGHGALVTVLLLRGAEITEKDAKGKTALMRAAETGNAPIVKTLLTANNLLKAPADAMKALGVDIKLPSVPFKNLPLGTVDVDARDQSGQTALHYAARLGHSEAVSALLGVGATNSVPDAEGNTPLMLAASAGQLAVVKLFVHQWSSMQTGVNSKTGKTVLMLAAAQGDADCVRHLVEQFARFHGFRPDQPLTQLTWVDRQDNAGKNALHYAEEKGHKVAAEYLRDYTGLNQQDADGQTRLMKAAAAGDLKAVQALLRLKADLQPRDAKGRNALMLAAAGGHADITLALLESAGTRRHERLEYLEQKDKSGGSAESHARQHAHLGLANQLASFSSLETVDDDGLTPLMKAAQEGDGKLAQRLLAFGAEVQARDKQKRTALMLAAIKGDAETIARLVEKIPQDKDKAEFVMLKDREGRTALMYAVEEGHAEAIVALFRSVDWGRAALSTTSYTNLQDKKNRTARSIAKEKGFADLQQLLEKY